MRREEGSYCLIDPLATYIIFLSSKLLAWENNCCVWSFCNMAENLPIELLSRAMPPTQVGASQDAKSTTSELPVIGSEMDATEHKLTDIKSTNTDIVPIQTESDNRVQEEDTTNNALVHPPTIFPRIPHKVHHISLHKAGQTLARPFKRQAPTFHKFMEFPLEIRMQIWEATIEPRVHELHPCAKLYNDRMTFRSNSSRTPSIFHVCSESRELALKHYQLMEYTPPPQPTSGKGILRFYFSPDHDTLLLNSLMGLFIMFMLLEEEDAYVGVGAMKGWQRVAFDAERAQLISLLSGITGHAPQPRFKAVFPALRELIIAFDYTSGGKTRFRTSVWPGENGTTLKELVLPPPLDEDSAVFDTIFKPMREYLENDFDEESVPGLRVAKVKRKVFIRGDLRYAFRKTCSFLGLRPRGVFRRL